MRVTEGTQILVCGGGPLARETLAVRWFGKDVLSLVRNSPNQAVSKSRTAALFVNSSSEFKMFLISSEISESRIQSITDAEVMLIFRLS